MDAIRHSGFIQALLFMLLAVLALAGNHLLVITFGVAGFAFITLFAVISFLLLPPLAISLLVTSLFFQNTILTALIGMVPDTDTFRTLQGTSFIITAIMALLALLSLLRHNATLPAHTRKLIFAAIIFMGVCALYAAYGFIKASPASVLSYTRLYLVGPFLLLIGMWLSLFVKKELIISLLAISAALFVLWGLAEAAFTYTLYDLFNIDHFLRLKFFDRENGGFFETVRATIAMNTRAYLNLSGSFGLSFDMLRLKGPNIHEISYGYALMFLALAAFMTRHTVLMVLCIIFAVLVGAKGPLILLFGTLGLYAAYRLTGHNIFMLKKMLLGVLMLYLVGGLVYGFMTQDYHVVGFMGGIKGFFGNPLGHGIGVGGNMSDLAFEGRDFAKFQMFGADYALESAIGVGIYQLGLGFAALLFFYGRLWRGLWQNAMTHHSTAPRLMVIPIALGFLFINMVFQEESLSPTGWGLWLLWAGILLSWSQPHHDTANNPSR